MHMADALLSPAVGGTMWAATAGTIAYCSRKVREEADDSRVPMMGVLAAFVFAAQMINFTIPATGSSGHLGGGLLLAILLGPYAAFLAMASVLTVQALFFADGGLLALGCNIFNLVVFPCFFAYPLIYQRIVGENSSEKRIFIAALLSAVLGLQLGAFAVVLETVSSGLAELPFKGFLLVMQPLHLAIGVVEGLVTAAVVLFVRKARPEILRSAAGAPSINGLSCKKVLIGLLVATLVAGGALSWFASTNPDGLEWAISDVLTAEPAVQNERYGVHALLAEFQDWIVIFPDYVFSGTGKAEDQAALNDSSGKNWPAVKAETTVSGLVGGGITLVLAAAVGLFLKRRIQAGTT